MPKLFYCRQCRTRHLSDPDPYGLNCSIREPWDIWHKEDDDGQRDLDFAWVEWVERELARDRARMLPEFDVKCASGCGRLLPARHPGARKTCWSCNHTEWEEARGYV